MEARIRAATPIEQPGPFTPMESEAGGDDGRLIPTTIDAIFNKGWTRASEGG